ncbi:hypothetical protein NB636_04295 [Oxalobacter aliiformigenes]|nr:hypothetical protein [Oxalobacter aliiformigenes]MCZ4065603.1 hypothetical protein [Oxalobacter aliiformigenes]WAW00069.1 hypothetical protein NB636_04295 [Oxalobacter aliiformigenes]
MNGLLDTVAVSGDTRSATISTVPTKKTTRRSSDAFTAIGITFSGLLVSPAATPISSVPE